VEEAVQRLGGVDVLIHSAGGPAPGRLEDVTPEAWYEAFEVHVHAVFHLSRAALPHMRAKKQGAIVLISSVAGIRGVPNILPYQAVKGALPQLTRALARDLAADNIRVNCVSPGIIRTRFHARMTEEQKRLNLDQRIPLGREGTPEQVAEVIALLVKNDYVTGENYVVDGGLTMRIA
jgi:NAD(P)-dependent dehydrogenase (short-subunit alcohol dehydrogenase family)